MAGGANPGRDPTAMTFWKRRKPADLVVELTEAMVPWPAPSEVIYEFPNQEQHVHDPETCTLRKCSQRVALRDKIKMTSIRG